MRGAAGGAVGAAPARNWAARVAKSSGEMALARKAASSCCSSVGAAPGVESSGLVELSVIAIKIRAYARRKEKFYQSGKTEIVGAASLDSVINY